MGLRAQPFKNEKFRSKAVLTAKERFSFLLPTDFISISVRHRLIFWVGDHQEGMGAQGVYLDLGD